MSAARDQLAIQVSAEYGTQLTKNIPIAINVSKKMLERKYPRTLNKVQIKNNYPKCPGPHSVFERCRYKCNEWSRRDSFILLVLHRNMLSERPKTFRPCERGPGHSLINPPK